MNKKCLQLQVNKNCPKKVLDDLTCMIYLSTYGSYSDYPDNPIFVCYQQWYGKNAFGKWIPQYLDFNYVIDNLKKQNKKFYNFGRISSQDKNIIYRLIWKQ